MGKLKLFKDGQFIELNTFPIKASTSFSTPTVTAAGGVTTVDHTFHSRALIRRLKITPSNGSANSMQFEFFKDGSFLADKLEYQATASGTFIDNDVWFHEDEDLLGELHFRVTNNSLVGSQFTVEILAEVFA